jgi:thiamine-phosphate pyrophosphorylase
MSRRPLRGLYAITSASLCAEPARLHVAVDAVLRGGAVLLQYRDKLGDPTQRLANARALCTRCRDHGARFIVNDDVELALAVDADGVHLGSRDAPLAAARARLGAAAILGASCGPELARATAAIAQGASYIAFGRFFDSQTKPDAPQAALESLQQARRQFSVPICAIGGVTPHNAGPLVAAGADLIAAVEGLFGDPDPAVVERRARAYSQLFFPPS